MRLIAKKPCSFGGKKFFIGDEIAQNLIADFVLQEKLGVINIVKDDEKLSEDSIAGTFTQEQVNTMINKEVSLVTVKLEQKQKELQDAIAKLEENQSDRTKETIQIPVKNGQEKEKIIIFATSEEIQQVFTMLQLNVNEAVKAIANIKNKNVLRLLYAGDHRKAIQNAVRGEDV